MAKQKSLKLNFIMNAILTMSSFIFPLITFPYVSRVLLPIGTGKVSLATSIIAYFSMFAQLGIPTYGIRACAKVRDDKEKLTRTVQEIFLINLIMGIISYAVFFVVLFSVPRINAEKELYLIISTTIFFNVIGMEWLYKAMEQYTYITVRSIIFKFVALIMMFILIHNQEDYVLYGGITILAAVGSNIFNFINVHKYVSLRPVGNYKLLQHMSPIMTFFAMTVASTIYTNLDIVILGFVRSDIDVGYYNAAVRIKTILVSIVTSLGTVLLPRASYYIENGMKEEFLKITKKAIRFVAIAATPMMLYFILFAKEGIYFLSGEAYTGSILPMQIIMPTLLFIGMSNILGIQMLVPLGKEKVVLRSTIIGAIVDLIINILLVPTYGAIGAAVGNAVAEFVVWMYQLIYMRKQVVDAYKEISYVPLIIGLALGSVTSLSVKLLGLSSFFTLLLSAIVFFGVYFVVLIVAKESLVIDILNQFLGKLRNKK